MSWAIEPPRRRRRGRGILSVLLALLAVAGLAVGGYYLPAQSATFVATAIPTVGRTSTVCTAAAAERGSQASVGAVVTRRAPGRTGTLTVAPLGQPRPTLKLTDQGIGRLLPATAPVVLRADGVMARASSGGVFGIGTSGAQRGLMAAACGLAGTEHWFVGVGAASTARSDLILTNPDDSLAEVDLTFFGAKGEVVVPGSPGVVVPAQGSRNLSLESLSSIAGPLSVSVTATTGRVAAVTRDLRSAALTPAGADWHRSAVAPSTSVVIPGVPAGEGPRQLLVVNPGTGRARVQVQALALTGPFAPAGATTLDVAPRSTAVVDLAPGLLGQAAGVALRSSSPITGSVLSTSTRPGAAADFAVQPATGPLESTGVVALATMAGVDSELVLSNGTGRATLASLEVVGYNGVSLHTDEVLLGPHSTSTRRINQVSPAYLEVTVPDGSAVRGSVVFDQPEGGVAGLSTVELTSPDVAQRAQSASPDPSVGR
ncbi:MAG TPA: DUF5719 family protein [Propionibacteriaceae bacterium]|nr:DUF5719 family protein [Propionibacteriaceae bacterium]